MSGVVRDRLAAWSTTAASALAAALDAVAEELAADLSRQLPALGTTTADEATTVMVSRDGAGRTTVAVTRPDVEAREYGTRAVPASPVVRPAVAALRGGLRARVTTALRATLSGIADQ